jgi:hypothetical protein
MKKITLLFLVVGFAFLAGCSNSEESSNLASKVYQLRYTDDPSLLGKVTFTENSDGSTTVFLELNGTSDDVHPAYIYYNNLTQGGPIAITLNAIDCDCEDSTTLVSKLDNGTAISFEQLLTFNGHIKVHQSSSEMETILLQGNIGSNGNNIY